MDADALSERLFVSLSTYLIYLCMCLLVFVYCVLYIYSVDHPY